MNQSYVRVIPIVMKFIFNVFKNLIKHFLKKKNITFLGQQIKIIITIISMNVMILLMENIIIMVNMIMKEFFWNE